jgi:hypothetical protein
MGILLYVLGLVVLVSGLGWIATLFGLAQPYVAGFALVMLATAAIASFVNARARARHANVA